MVICCTNVVIASTTTGRSERLRSMWQKTILVKKFMNFFICHLCSGKINEEVYCYWLVRLRKFTMCTQG
jgi:hypothetical protein